MRSRTPLVALWNPCALPTFDGGVETALCAPGKGSASDTESVKLRLLAEELTNELSSSLGQERTLAKYNGDVLGVLEAFTLRLSRLETAVDGLNTAVGSLAQQLSSVASDTASAAANTQVLRDKQLLLEETQRLAETTLSEAKHEVSRLKDVAKEAAKEAVRELQSHQQQQQAADAGVHANGGTEDGATERAMNNSAALPPAVSHPAPAIATAPMYAPPAMSPPPPAMYHQPPPLAPPAYVPDYHPQPPPGLMMPPPPMDAPPPPAYGFSAPPMHSMGLYPPMPGGMYSPPPPAPLPPPQQMRGPPPPAPQLSSQAVSVEKVISDVSAMGFSAAQVRDAIAALTANGQGSVDLNAVIDRLMNGPGSVPRAQYYQR